ncbi:MAG: hypothetical protein ACKV2Q_31935 [Planctomycetaceae bacterium]
MSQPDVNSEHSPERTKLRPIWQRGDLFHNFQRYPRRRDAKKVDRLASILANGLVAPGLCSDGSVCSDLHITVTGLSQPYDRLVFLHLFGDQSSIYTISDPGRVTLFVDPELEFLTHEDMGTHWPLLCQDEVYVRDRIPVEKIIAVVAHRADADSILAEFRAEFQRLGIPLYRDDCTIAWAPCAK